MSTSFQLKRRLLFNRGPHQQEDAEGSAQPLTVLSPESRAVSVDESATQGGDFSFNIILGRIRQKQQDVEKDSEQVSPEAVAIQERKPRPLSQIERFILFQRLAPQQKLALEYSQKFHRSKTDPQQFDKLREIIRQGFIPDPVHGLLWMHLCDGERLKLENPGLYEELLSSDNHLMDDVILRDVGRTVPNSEFGALLDDRMQKVLFRLLRAVSIKNKDISYFQGMNNLGAMLLFYFKEEDAFWILDSLLSKPPYELGLLFLGNSELLYRYLKEFDQVLKVVLPKVHEHLVSHGVFPIFYLTEWIATLFTYNIPFQACLWLWDMFFLEGRIFLFYGSLAILRSMQDEILKIDNFEELVPFIKKIGTYFIFRKDLIAALRSLHIPKEMAIQLSRHFQDNPSPPDFISVDSVSPPTPSLHITAQSPANLASSPTPKTSPASPTQKIIDPLSAFASETKDSLEELE